MPRYLNQENVIYLDGDIVIRKFLGLCSLKKIMTYIRRYELKNQQ